MNWELTKWMHIYSSLLVISQEELYAKPYECHEAGKGASKLVQILGSICCQISSPTKVFAP